MAALAVALWLIGPRLDSGWLHLATIFCIYAVALQAMNIVFGYAGQLSLAHVGLYGSAAYISGLLGSKADWPPALSACVAVASCAVLGALCALPTLRVRGLMLAIVTLAFGVIAQNLFGQMNITGRHDGLGGIPLPSLAGHEFDGVGLFHLFVVTALIVFVATRNLLRTSWGRAWEVVREDEVAAVSLGIAPFNQKVVVFALSGGLAGLAGSMFAHYSLFIAPEQFGLPEMILWYLGLILGGSGTIWGPWIGAAALAYLPTRMPGSEHVKPLLWGALLVAVLVLFPQGITRTITDRFPGRRVGQARDRVAGAVPGPRPAAGDHEPVIADPRRFVAAPDPSVPVVSSTLRPGPVLAIDAVSVTFGGNRALQDVSLAVPAGQVHALLGPNGSGKTTLLNVITGFQRPDHGTVTFVGEEVIGLPPAKLARRGLGRTFQHLHLVEGHTALTSVETALHGRTHGNLFGAITGSPGSRARARAHRDEATELLARFGLAAFANTPVLSLSQGHRQLVAVVRAVALRPRLLLLDEPAAGLSLPEIELLGPAVRSVVDGGVGVLLVEHRLDFVRLLASTATCLDGGRVIADGPVDRVLDDPAVLEVYLGKPRVNGSPTLSAALDEVGAIDARG